MKLFTKYSRINVVATIVIFIVASVAFYFSLRYVLIQQINDDLKIEEKEITTYVREHNKLPESFSVNDQLIRYAPEPDSTPRHFGRANLIDSKDEDAEAFRQLVFSIKANNQWYKVTVSKSLEGTENLTRSILFVSFITILLILVVSFVINRVVLKQIWKPFYHSLDSVKKFKVSKEQPLHLPEEEIDEFQFMNQTLERITRQAQLDYLSLKTFSENASHEIQTPIAIIRSKLDLLIQDEHLTEQQSQTLQTTYSAIQKLSRLNQSLLLLAKIENNQFEEIQPINLKEKLEEKINEFHELWQSQNLQLHCSLQSAGVQMNAELCDILLNNLLSNATKHNYRNGEIKIELNLHQLKISNTSREEALEPEKMFKRFYKTSQGNQHTGLGLSIIKQICDASDFSLAYNFVEGFHAFTVLFSKSL